MKKRFDRFGPKNISMIVISLIVVSFVALYSYSRFNHRTTIEATSPITNPQKTGSCQKEDTYTKQQVASFISNYEQSKTASLTASYFCGGASVADGGYWVNNSLSASNKVITDNQQPVYDASPPAPITSLRCNVAYLSATSAVLHCGHTDIAL